MFSFQPDAKVGAAGVFSHSESSATVHVRCSARQAHNATRTAAVTVAVTVTETATVMETLNGRGVLSEWCQSLPHGL